MRKNRNNYFWGFGGSVAILLLLSGVNYFHFFDELNNSAYDFFSRHAPSAISSNKRSLLIECYPEQSQSGDGIWLNLVELLKKSDARQIVFTFFPEGATEIFYKKLASDKKIYFGREVTFPKQSEEPISMVPLPEKTSNTSLQTALQIIPPATKGVFRNQYATVSLLQDQPTTHLVRRTVEDRLEMSYDGKDVFTVNFNGMPPESQPRLDLTQALAGNLIRSLVSDKTVFIGLKSIGPYSGLRTPVANNSQKITPAQYLAYSFDTLLYKKTLRKANPILIFFIFALFIFAGIVVCQFLTTGLAIVSICFAIALSTLFSWLIFVFGLVQIPLAELQLGQCLLLLLVVSGKALLVEENIQAMAFTTKLQLQERLLPDTFYASPQYWHQIVGMVRQILNLDRSIFLERIPDGYHLLEVAAANSSINDIAERRRDYRRTPYSTALEENGAIEVYNFLANGVDGERQYVIPLQISDGEVLGFWSFSVSPEQLKTISEILSLVNTFAPQISEMLYARKLFQDEQKRLKSPLRKLLALEGGTEMFGGINDAFSLLSRRLDTVESVFDGLNTGAILYDLFGQVVYANKKITSLCQDLNVSPYKLSSSELIHILTDQALDEIRETLADHIFNGEKMTFHSRELGERQITFLLTVTTVSGSSRSEQLNSDEPHLQQIRGILLELHELTDIKKIMRLNKGLFNHSNSYFNTYRKSLYPVLDKLRNTQLTQEIRDKLIDFIEKKLSLNSDYIKRVGELLTQNILSGETLYFPTDCVEALKAAITRIKPEAASRKVHFILEIPDHMVPVLAVPDELENIFQGILRYLFNDAEPQSDVTISFKRKHKFIECCLRNKGYGMPNHDFQNYLLATETELSTNFRALQDARKQIAQYDGQFTATSELGKGTKFIIALKRFQ